MVELSCFKFFVKQVFIHPSIEFLNVVLLFMQVIQALSVLILSPLHASSALVDVFHLLVNYLHADS